MTEQKKSIGGPPVTKDDGWYAVVPNGSVVTIAEAEGHTDLSTDVATLLAEDVTYRLREIIQNASQYMRHAKRKQLNVEDLNRALRSSDVQPVFGHGAPEGQSWRQTKEGELYFVEDLDLSLPNVACNSQVPNHLGCTSVKANWLVIEGNQKGVAVSQAVQGKGNGKLGRCISDDLMQYHEHVTKAILGSDQELMKHALTDLRTNPNIAPLLPYLVEFVSSWVKTINYDPSKLRKMLYTIQAIISNDHLFLEPQPYLSLLIEVVVYSLMEPPDNLLTNFSDHWIIRDYAARLLANICRQWETSANKLREKMLGVLSDVLHDVTRPFTAHYGAILALCYFGEKALRDILLPYLSVYWEHLMGTLKDITLYKDKLDAHKVHGVLLCSSAIILKYFDDSYIQHLTLAKKQKETKVIKKEPGLFELQDTSKIKLEMDTITNSDDNTSESEELLTLSKCYIQFYEHFGESILSQLPTLSYKSFKKPVFKEKEVSLADADSQRTGEEMLQEFLMTRSHPGGAVVKTERIPFMKMESTASSDLEVSNNSDGRSSYEGDDSHLTVKATVSDPSKGIKLFISKKRSKAKEEDLKKKGIRGGKVDTKQKRQASLQNKLQETFELTELKPMKSISFGFSPVDWKGNPQNIYRYSKVMSTGKPFPSVKSEYQKLCLSLKIFGKVKRKSKDETCLQFYSASSLDYIL